MWHACVPNSGVVVSHARLPDRVTAICRRNRVSHSSGRYHDSQCSCQCRQLSILHISGASFIRRRENGRRGLFHRLLCCFDTSPVDSGADFTHRFWSDAIENSHHPPASERRLLRNSEPGSNRRYHQSNFAEVVAELQLFCKLMMSGEFSQSSSGCCKLHSYWQSIESG